MWEAMQEARLAIFDSVGGARTWGAYQHYGNPHFRLFDRLEPQATTQTGDVAAAADATTGGAAVAVVPAAPTPG